MSGRNTILQFVILAALLTGAPLASSQVKNETSLSNLTGTVIDVSGAVIAGATVEVRSTAGTSWRTTQSDRGGSFVISGLAAGNYRLVVSRCDFETKEIPVTIRTTETPAPMRISLAVGPVSTTIGVEGREDDLIG